jgi:flagellar biosynthesis protein FlhF
MHLKWFKGTSVAEVMDQIRAELGPDALILHSKTAKPRGPLGIVRGGGVEILAAVDEAAPPAAPEAAAAPADAPATRLARAPAAGEAAAGPVPDRLLSDVATLKHLLVQWGGGRLLPPPLTPYYERLVVAGVEPALALQILTDVPAPSAHDPSAGAAMPDEAVRQAVARMIPAAPAAPEGVVALVGPAGSGKTAALAKLAAQARMGGGRSGILNLDDGGFGALSVLEALAGILDLPYAQAAAAGDVAEQVRESAADLLLIDTPGIGIHDAAGIERLAEGLAAAAPREVHLVLPATMKTADALAAVRAFSRLGLTHLLFTRLDETASCGSVLAVSVESGLPLSYFGTGREIPADLTPAAPELIVNRIFTQQGQPA